MEKVRSGKMIKCYDGKGKEHFFNVALIKGNVVLFNLNGSYAMRRVLRDDNTFKLWKKKYKYEF